MSKNKFQKRIDTVSANTHKRIDEIEEHTIEELDRIKKGFRITSWVCLGISLSTPLWDIIQGWLAGTAHFSSNYNPGMGRNQVILAVWFFFMYVFLGYMGRKKK